MATKFPRHESKAKRRVEEVIPIACKTHWSDLSSMKTKTKEGFSLGPSSRFLLGAAWPLCLHGNVSDVSYCSHDQSA